jgi:UDP-N-acetylmuramyl tripeptide synthase
MKRDMSKLRFVFAFLAAKLSVAALKITGHMGTNFPGKLALKLCPDFLRYIRKPAHIIAVTGTNGKTTVSNLLCDLLERDGKPALSNRYGSNIASGIATTLIAGCDLLGREKYGTAVLEIDERSAPRIFPWVRPQYAVVTNLFRDSIMRNAHPAYIADILTQNFPAETVLILNADDLISCRVSPENPRVYFGIERMDSDVTDCVNLINDIRICPECHSELRYEYRRYHHIGRAVCDACGFASPAYDIAGADVDFGAMTMRIRDAEGEAEYRLLSDSIFNVYNMISAAAVLRQLGYGHARIAELMDGCAIVATRHNEEQVGDVTLVMQMAKEKNALACSRAFDYVAGSEGTKELVLMMNCLGDVKHWSENVSWLYDCDFEFLNRPDIRCIVATGARALDYRLRLLLAGVPEEKIVCIEDEMEAVTHLPFTPGDQVYLFYGTDSLVFAQKVRARLAELAKEAAAK